MAYDAKKSNDYQQANSPVAEANTPVEGSQAKGFGQVNSSKTLSQQAAEDANYQQYLAQKQGNQQAQSSTSQPVSTNGTKDNGSRKPRLAILDANPPLDEFKAQILAQHQQRRIGDVTVEEAHPEVMAHYDFMATIDPSSATFDPPAHDYTPMPYGGLDVVAQHLIGPLKPGATPEQTAQYKLDVENVKNLVFRMNTDTLRTTDQYKLGQLIRVPTETV